MDDIFFKTDDYVFSYRAAGICVQNGKVLLQKASNDIGYAFPGGQAQFGETNQQTLIREFKEEINAEITVGDLKWVGEIFFPFQDKLCHQICLFYIVDIKDDSIPKEGMFMAKEFMEGRTSPIEYHWVPLEKVNTIEVYPVNAKKLLPKLDQGVQHFVYRE